ncbi:hypothetical protein IAE37_004770 [Pseudomonas sp. S31]|uniref:hypothetical protein n=1 Tax=Pseudomonas sp. S31 TaxID=1564473 RepID=UPI001911345B|nr:hypothetical protein [Pseudomonas sp. S31]MBK5002494.1 hypothetical protein [Pseudomonas sp. S31]
MAENKLLTPALPDLIIEEATEEGGIDLDLVTQGATVFIAASANLQAQDQVRIAVMGAYSDSKTHSVIQPGEQRFKIDYSVIKANENGSIGVTYFVQPGGNPPEQSTGTVEYDVRATVGKGLLQVLGARHTRSAQRAAYASRYLRAYQADTGQPIMAEWRYCGSPEWSSAGEWLDSQPHLPLQVRAEHDLVTLNPANIIGNGIYMSSPTGIGAFVALRNDGRVVGWGDAGNGGLIPTVIRTLDDVVEVSCTSGAYAARRADGSIVVWGVPTEGGDLGEVSPEGFREVIGNAQAFAGIKETGAVVAGGRAALAQPCLNRLLRLPTLCGLSLRATHSLHCAMGSRWWHGGRERSVALCRKRSWH